jgi:hypothetical protein
MISYPSHKTHYFKNTICWLSLLIMFGFFISLFFEDLNPTRKEITLTINMENKVNICLPEENETLIPN